MATTSVVSLPHLPPGRCSNPPQNPTSDPAEGTVWRHARKLLAAGSAAVQARSVEEIRIGSEQRLVISIGQWFHVVKLDRIGKHRLAQSMEAGTEGQIVRVSAVRVITENDACDDSDADCDCTEHREKRAENGGAE